jgi:hypothetical protein
VTRRDALDLGLMALSLASLIARVFAMAMCDLDQAMREWVEEEVFVPEVAES